MLNALKPDPAHSVVVFGAGTVGLSAVMAAKYLGCQTVIVVDLQPARLALAQELGATHVVDASASDPVPLIAEITSGGADFVIEASGAPTAGPAAVASLGVRGTCALVGAPPFGTKLELDWINIVSSRTVRGVVFGGGHPADTIAALLEMRSSGALPVERLVRTYPFDAIDKAIADMESGSTVKPVLLAPAAG